MKVLCIVWLVISGIGFARPTERSDVAHRLKKLDCDNLAKALMNPDAYFADAQIAGQIVARRTKNDANQRAQQAERFAKKNLHRGFATGICPDDKGKAWLISMPSPLSWEDFQAKAKTHPMALNAVCEELILYQAEPGISRPKLLELRDLPKLKQKLAGDQLSLSVLCKPKQPNWLGPQLLYLISQSLPPNLPLPKPSETFHAGELFVWIQGIREKLQLAPLARAHQAEATLNSLQTLRSNIHHNRHLNRSLAANLKRKLHLEWLGENRVIAKSTREMAELMWRSPSHRALVLSPEATKLSIVHRPVKDGHLAVLSLLGPASGPIAKK